MSETVETILLYTIGAGLLSIVYGYFTGKNILNQSTGNAKMQDIASAIQIGAKAYLARQYKTIAIVGVVVLVIVSIAFSPLVGLGYLVGAALSGIAGYVGMLVSVEANVRTAEASRKGLAQGLSVAFKSGAVTGMLVAGLALLAIAVYYYVLSCFSMSKLFFFRHGQASLGAANYDVLSDKGIRQSKLLGEYLLSEQILFDKQSRRRGGHRTGAVGVTGLIALAVAGVVPFDVGR